jgi:hypothetical protein
MGTARRRGRQLAGGFSHPAGTSSLAHEPEDAQRGLPAQEQGGDLFERTSEPLQVVRHGGSERDDRQIRVRAEPLGDAPTLTDAAPQFDDQDVDEHEHRDGARDPENRGLIHPPGGGYAAVSDVELGDGALSLFVSLVLELSLFASLLLDVLDPDDESPALDLRESVM